MKRLTGFAFRLRAAVIAAFAAVTAFLGFWIKDLALNSDVTSTCRARTRPGGCSPRWTQ